MKLLLVLSLLILPLSSQAEKKSTAYNIEVAKKRCLASPASSKEVFSDDFSWGMTLLEMEDRFEDVYASEKRLYLHAQYKPKTNEFKLLVEDKSNGHKPFVINENFIKSITIQIETAIKKGYANFVFFPDMGHSHLNFPQEHWDKEYKDVDKSWKNWDKLYEKMLNDPKMKPLYHLTEQLKMTDENKNVLPDPVLSFLYWHRNFLGSNDGTDAHSIEVSSDDSKYNTVGHIDGYERWGAGYAISASSKGCFPYYDKNGEVRYFDIGLYDPRYNPDTVSTEDFTYTK